MLTIASPLFPSRRYLRQYFVNIAVEDSPSVVHPLAVPLFMIIMSFISGKRTFLVYWFWTQTSELEFYLSANVMSKSQRLDIKATFADMVVQALVEQEGYKSNNRV